MNPNPIRVKQSARFTEDRLRHAAKRVALIKAQQDLAGVEGICEMVDDFELLATQQGLPANGYAAIERAHLAIGNALLVLNPKLAELKAYGF